MLRLARWCFFVSTLAVILVSATACAARTPVATVATSTEKPSQGLASTTTVVPTTAAPTQTATATPTTSTAIPSPAGAAVTVGIDCPPSVSAGAEFTAMISVTQVTDFAAYQFQVAYDPAVIQVVGEEGGAGLTPGLVGSTTIPLDGWVFSPPGKQGRMIVLGHLSGAVSTTGSGYLVQVHFRAVGAAGQKSDITLSQLKLFNVVPSLISEVNTVGGLVQIAASH